jgi:acyl-CoA synthetase (AMP-forming)/AMP-acid ligase II
MCQWLPQPLRVDVVALAVRGGRSVRRDGRARLRGRSLASVGSWPAGRSAPHHSAGGKRPQSMRRPRAQDALRAQVVANPIALLAALRGVTRLVTVPAVLRALVSVAPAQTPLLPDLRLLVSSGEPLHASLGEQLAKRLGRCEVLNLYGSTEAAADCTAHDVRSSHPQRAAVRCARALSAPSP